MSLTSVSHLSDADLIARLTETCLEAHRLTGRIVVYLREVEERRLDLRAACTSMFDFCVRRLGMSEGAAYRRINAARLVRRFPCLLGPIERGELHLSTLVVLRPHLTEENVDELVAKFLGKTHREVLELLAAVAPRPDVPAIIRELPSIDAGPAQRVLAAGAGAAPEASRSAIARGAPVRSALRGAAHGKQDAARQARTRARLDAPS